MDKTYIYDAIRTPRGLAKEHGSLHSLTPMELMKQLYTALENRSAINPADVDDIMLGCVSQVGEQGGNIARASAVYAGWPDHVPGITVNRFCSSSLDAACLASDRIAAGNSQLLVTGGVESMSRVPMLSDKASWMTDPATIYKTRTVPLGNAADLIATQEGFSRKDLDQYAQQSQQRAQQAQDNGYFDPSIIAMKVKGAGPVTRDEAIRGSTTIDQLAELNPAFAKLGESGIDAELLKIYPELEAIQHHHTVGNAPGMVDGASLVLMGNLAVADRIDKKPLAEIIGYHSTCGPVPMVLSGGILAAEQLLKKQGFKANDLGVVEFNESFAGPTLKFIRDLNLDPATVNVNGGAISLGHPMGATGGMLIGMLVDELQRQDKELGMVSICGATGSGTAMLIRLC